MCIHFIFSRRDVGASVGQLEYYNFPQKVVSYFVLFISRIVITAGYSAMQVYNQRKINKENKECMQTPQYRLLRIPSVSYAPLKFV